MSADDHQHHHHHEHPDAPPGGAERFGPVLVGLRGSGKSTVAPLAAELLGLEAVDADAELERRAGLRIPEIFAAEGEEGFRRRERELLNELLRRPGIVLATGGGAVLHDEARALMAQRQTFWLHAPVEVLADRIRGTDRPRLTRRTNLGDELGEVLAVRAPLYSAASTMALDCSVARPAQLAEAIAEIWRAAQGIAGPACSCTHHHHGS